MKTVAFFVQDAPSSWLGGVSYLNNLVAAVNGNPDRQIQPVLVSANSAAFLRSATSTTSAKIESPLASESNLIRKAGRVARLTLGRDFALELLAIRHGLNIISHYAPTGRRSRIPSIAWIPDFQHIRMPQFFTRAESIKRNVAFSRLIRDSRLVIVSSDDAARDFEKFMPGAKEKVRVLPFVSSVAQTEGVEEPGFVREKYGIDRPYFLVPNQFWKHKNHEVLIDALALIKKNRRPPLVVATGRTDDPRFPGHFDELITRAKAQGVLQEFKPLGMVPYSDLQTLMRSAIALINPSLFEGWSTSVEEAKTLGLTIILSNIPVHCEQAPRYGCYFSPENAKELAAHITAVERDYDPSRSEDRMRLAALEFPLRAKRFAEQYERIALESLSKL